MRLYLYAAFAALLIGAAATIYFLGARNATDKARTDQLERTLDNADTFNEGAGNPDGLPWACRLWPDTCTD